MMMMTAKVQWKKVGMVACAVAGAVLLLLSLLGRGGEPVEQPPRAGDNDARVSFLRDFGWEVSTSPVQSGQVLIPQAPTEAYERYNTLQKSQGYDLTRYAGQKVMRYVYAVTNYPGSGQPVYATVLVLDGQIIGGDITDTAPGGAIHGFRMPQKPEKPQTVPESTPETAPEPPAGSAPQP